MPTVTNSGDFVHFSLNWTPCLLVPWPLEHNCLNQSTKHVGFKALVISKSFSSLLIGWVRRPTPRTDKGSSSITDNMITFNGILGRAIHLLVWKSSNIIVIILYQGYANSNTFLWFCSFFIELNTLSSGTMTNALWPLRMSLQKQPIQILYYLTQLQMTSNNM
jgi:hypothetical protein